MSTKPHTPIIVGVADIKNKSKQIEDAIEPSQLMLSAIQSALNDTALSKANQSELQHSLDSLSVVATWTWPYPDLPQLLSENLGASPRYKTYSQHGGNQPIKLVDEAARRVASGESKVAVVVGGEALASLKACAAADKLPPPGWSAPDATKSSLPVEAASLPEGPGNTHQIGLPIHIYPLYENALRAKQNQTIEANHEESAKMYANFAKIAESNPYAWNYGEPAKTQQEIATVTEKNRMIYLPYPLLMNAFNNVNLAASCIMTSTEYARELGIPENRWIYPLGGAGTQEADNFWQRPNFHHSAAITRSIDASLSSAGLTKNDIDIFDFYSCFPIVPKLACRHLEISPTNPSKPITLLGGLTSFGGAGNNYSMHALTAMVRSLRNPPTNGKASTGLILANGGVLTYQHALCLSSSPRKDQSPYPDKNPLPQYIADEEVPSPDAHVVASAPEFTKVARGKAIIETYTIAFNRAGVPFEAFIIGRLVDSPDNSLDNTMGRRFIANAGDVRTVEAMAGGEGEVIGRIGSVEHFGWDGRNKFFIKMKSRRMRARL